MMKRTITALLLISSLAACSPIMGETTAALADAPLAGQPSDAAVPSPAARPSPPPAPAPTPSPSPTPTPTPAPLTAKLNAVGDFMLHQWQVDDALDPETGEYDFDKAFEEISPYLAGGYTLGNLETVFGGGGFHDFPMFNGVDGYAGAIARAGVDLLSTANNHSNDRREGGILRTLEILDQAGLGHVGTYASQEARDGIFIKEIGGISFAFLSYTYGLNGMTLPQGKQYMANIIDEGQMLDDIRRADESGCDFVVVLPHLGNEYETQPRQTFKDWIRLMLEAGADIVLASHPHVLQPAEFVDINGRECFVAYSLGNFISSQRTQPRDAGVILTLHFEKPHGQPAAITDAGFTPTWVQFRNSSGEYDIKVLPVEDTLLAVENGAEHDLRPQDVNRLKAVWEDAAGIYGDMIKTGAGKEKEEE